MLPVWGPHNTTECRLVVERGAVMRDWDHCEHWERMCHDNRVVRGRHTFECTFFESDTASHSACQFTAERLDCCADCQRESAIWKAYMGGELDGADTANYLSALASRALWNGASQVCFCFSRGGCADVLEAHVGAPHRKGPLPGRARSTQASQARSLMLGNQKKWVLPLAFFLHFVARAEKGGWGKGGGLSAMQARRLRFWV